VSKEDEIIARARSLFDVAGVAVEPSTRDTILILGLVSTPERDLDDFAHDGAKTVMRGFERHAKSREDELIAFIRRQGFHAELVGVLGYPQEKPNLKHLAVAAGLGKQGKNTLVIHPSFGPWLRFMAIRTDAPLAATGPGVYSKEGSTYCSNCERCVRACPVGILEPYRLIDTDRCLAAISEERSDRVAVCDGCVVVCPVGERKVP
jgi:NAD-dependent dihydropyrimidine dehydrogenase PreA subunit